MAWKYGAEQQASLRCLKHELAYGNKALRRPNYNRDFFLYSDWSKHGIGAVLSQFDEDGHEYMIAYTYQSFPE